jgi:pseudomonalisin
MSTAVSRIGAGARTGLVLAGALLLLLGAATPAGAARLQTIRGEALRGLGSAHDLGAAPAGRRIIVAITVQKDLRALYRAEAALYNPKSPAYHRFLTPAQFQHLYGTPAAQVAAIRAFGTSRGLTLVQPGRLYDYVELSGTAAQVESTFHVQLDNFKDSKGQRFFANLQNPQVPAGLGIAAVLGLETYDRYHVADVHSAARKMLATPAQTKPVALSSADTKWLVSSPFAGPLTPELTNARTEKAAMQGGCQSDPSGSLGGVCTGLLSPQDLWNAYQMPNDAAGPTAGSENYGQGQTIGIIGEGQTADVIAALREFEATRNLPQVPVQVYHTDPGASASEASLDDSGRIEWEMDTQSSTGMAPDVSQVRMYFGSSLALTELTGAIGTWVNDPNGPLQVSASLGACEDNPAEDILLGAAQRADQGFLAQAAIEGRTLFASAGDTGTGCAPLGPVAVNGVSYDPYPAQEYPAIDPNTTAVGGTVLYTTPSGARQLERAWDHTGGGPSKFIEQPAYQTSANIPALQSNACPGVDGGGTPFPDGGHLCRADVDVSAESGDVTIVTDHKVGDLYPTGGYDPTTQPVQANGFDMVDFCPQSEFTSENPAQASCGYAGNGAGKDATINTDSGPQQGYMTDHFSEGGTSLSSPLWLGMWARVQAHHDAGNDPHASLGLANALIYKLGSNTTTGGRDFYDVQLGGNPLPAGPGWDFPTGWGSPNLKALIGDASGTPDGTAPVSTALPNGGDPPVLVAQAGSAPACTNAFYDSSADAPDGFNGQQDDQLDLVQGTLGLTPDHTKLRVVMNIRNLSKAIPTGSNYLDYELYWNYNATTYGVDVQVSSSGTVTYVDGTQTVTTANGTSNYQFNPNPSSTATGSFGSGPNGAIEVDMPLSEVGSPKIGEKLTAPGAYTADGINGQVTGLGFIADQDGPGTDYTVGQPTCIDPAASGSTGPQGSTGTTGSQGSTGTTGSQSGTGPQGSQGGTGPQGGQGSQGQSGPQGASGAAGPPGPAGTQGPAGATGNGGSPKKAPHVTHHGATKRHSKPKHKAKRKPSRPAKRHRAKQKSRRR